MPLDTSLEVSWCVWLHSGSTDLCSWEEGKDNTHKTVTSGSRPSILQLIVSQGWDSTPQWRFNCEGARPKPWSLKFHYAHSPNPRSGNMKVTLMAMLAPPPKLVPGHTNTHHPGCPSRWLSVSHTVHSLASTLPAAGLAGEVSFPHCFQWGVIISNTDDLLIMYPYPLPQAQHNWLWRFGYHIL